MLPQNEEKKGMVQPTIQYMKLGSRLYVNETRKMNFQRPIELEHHFLALDTHAHRAQRFLRLGSLFNFFDLAIHH